MRGDLLVHWQWLGDDKSWAPYTDAVSLVLERDRESGKTWSHLGGGFGGWCVDHATMQVQ